MTDVLLTTLLVSQCILFYWLYRTDKELNSVWSNLARMSLALQALNLIIANSTIEVVED